MVGNGMAENQGLFKLVEHHMDLDLGKVHNRYVWRIIYVCSDRVSSQGLGVDSNGYSSVLRKGLREDIMSCHFRVGYWWKLVLGIMSVYV